MITINIIKIESDVIVDGFPFAICVRVYIGRVVLPAGATSIVIVVSLNININPIIDDIKIDSLDRGSII